MRAMILRKTGPIGASDEPLEAVELPDPTPGRGDVRLRVSACGVCHTEIDEIEGRTPPPRLPVVPGHQIVGRVDRLGDGVSGVSEGDRVGVAWIHSACGHCIYCSGGAENLCADFEATGRDVDGGYAEYTVVPAAYVHPIPNRFADVEAAPLLCAGAVGYRALRLAGLENGRRLGLTGFGASGHQVLTMAHHRYPDSPVYVFARNAGEREFARELGAVWAGDTHERAPEALHAIIDTTPVWKPVVEALANLAPGGRLVINAIRKEDVDRGELTRVDYATHLWMEREIKSVANVTRRDVRECLELAAEIPLVPEVEALPLEDANRALTGLKRGGVRGAKVLTMAPSGPERHSRRNG